MILNDEKLLSELSIAIVQKACKDYKRAFMGDSVDYKRAKRALKELDDFFLTDEIKWYTSVNGEWLRDKMKLEAVNEAIETYETALGNITREQILIIVAKNKDNPKNIRYYVPESLKDDFENIMKNQLKKLYGMRAEIEEEIRGIKK